MRISDWSSDVCSSDLVRGTATDLLLLAARLEDADTLFFQRRLVLTGDTELGLTVRNLLDRLPWEAVPLAVRIGLNRGERLARAARLAHRGQTPTTCMQHSSPPPRAGATHSPTSTPACWSTRDARTRARTGQ